MELLFEAELEKSTLPFLKSQMSKFCWQVPIGNKVIDLAAIDPEGNVVGIEYKLHNWRKALVQAKKNANGFDYVYICVPQKQFRKDILDEAKSIGVGLLVLSNDNSVIELVPAIKNTEKWIPKYEYLTKYINERG